MSKKPGRILPQEDFEYVPMKEVIARVLSGLVICLILGGIIWLCQNNYYGTTKEGDRMELDCVLEVFAGFGFIITLIILIAELQGRHGKGRNDED